MCLVIDKNLHPTGEPIVLKKKLIVFKNLNEYGGYLHSPLYHFIWKRNEMMESALLKDPEYKHIINIGFHADYYPNLLLDKDKEEHTIHNVMNVFGVCLDLTLRVSKIDYGRKVAIMEIPAGASVYYGKDGDIVSNKMMLLYSIENPVCYVIEDNRIFIGQMKEKYFGQYTHWNYRQCNLSVYKRMLTKSLEALKKEGIKDNEVIRQLKKYKTTTNWLLFKNNVFKLLNIKTIC